MLEIGSVSLNSLLGEDVEILQSFSRLQLTSFISIDSIYHYHFRYTADPTIPDNTLAQIAINITLFHYGIHAWIVYCLVALLLALVSHRESLPMTMKSCFYPLIGGRDC